MQFNINENNHPLLGLPFWTLLRSLDSKHVAASVLGGYAFYRMQAPGWATYYGAMYLMLSYITREGQTHKALSAVVQLAPFLIDMKTLIKLGISAYAQLSWLARSPSSTLLDIVIKKPIDRIADIWKIQLTPIVQFMMVIGAISSFRKDKQLGGKLLSIMSGIIAAQHITQRVLNGSWAALLWEPVHCSAMQKFALSNVLLFQVCVLDFQYGRSLGSAIYNTASFTAQSLITVFGVSADFCDDRALYNEVSGAIVDCAAVVGR